MTKRKIVKRENYFQEKVRDIYFSREKCFIIVNEWRF